MSDDTSSEARDTYNGWRNRETWAVALHLSNDEGLYHAMRHVAADDRWGYDTKQFTEDWLFALVEDGNKNAYAVLTDIGSLWRVDWKAVRDSFRDE